MKRIYLLFAVLLSVPSIAYLLAAIFTDVVSISANEFFWCSIAVILAIFFGILAQDDPDI